MSRDHWLTTDKLVDTQEGAMEQLMAEWEAWADRMDIDPDIALEGHPHHLIYTSWLTVMQLVDALHQHEAAEAEAHQYEVDRSLEEHFREGFDEARADPGRSPGL